MNSSPVRTYIKDLAKNIDQEVSISGWVDIRRDHGKLIFIDIRDMSGKVQVVALPNNSVPPLTVSFSVETPK